MQHNSTPDESKSPPADSDVDHARSLARLRLARLNRELSWRDFPLATIGNGKTAHYIDDYRYHPPRSICGRWLTTDSESGSVLSEQWLTLDTTLPLCSRCERRTGYPTETEHREYMTCTDCGVDTLALGEVNFCIKIKVWEIAYPGYSQGEGVGLSRPCIPCLQKRLGRALTDLDFIGPMRPNTRAGGYSPSPEK